MTFCCRLHFFLFQSNKREMMTTLTYFFKDNHLSVLTAHPDNEQLFTHIYQIYAVIKHIPEAGCLIDDFRHFLIIISYKSDGAVNRNL